MPFAAEIIESDDDFAPPATGAVFGADGRGGQGTGRGSGVQMQKGGGRGRIQFVLLGAKVVDLSIFLSAITALA